MTRPHGMVPRPPFIGTLSILVDKLRDLASQTETALLGLLSAKETANKTPLLSLSDADEGLELCRITAAQRDRSAELAKAAAILAIRNGASQRAVADASGVSTNTTTRWVKEAYEQAAG